MTRTNIERSDLLEIAVMRARWKENARPEPQTKLLPAGASGLKQKCWTNSARSLVTIGANGPIRASAISVNRSGVSALAQCSHGKGFSRPRRVVCRDIRRRPTEDKLSDRRIATAATTYVDRILHGAKPNELPVQLPAKFELYVNLNTAKALGLTMPQSILAIADEVVE